MPTLRVLLIEKSKEDALVLLHLLQKGGYQIKHKRIDRKDEMEEALQDETWDLIISDHLMSSFNSLEALEILKKSNLDIPFIIYSREIGEENVAEAMKSGAHNFVSKINPIRLLPAIAREIKDARIRWEKKNAIKTIKKSEERLKNYLKNFQGIIYQTTSFLFVPTLLEGKVFEYTGYENSQFKEGKVYWEDIIHPHDLSMVKEEGERLAGGKKDSIDIEYRIINQFNEKERWVRDIGKRVQDQEGEKNFQGAIYDITAYKKIATDQIQFMSHHDLLTSLYNRFYLEEEIKHNDQAENLPN